MMDKNEIVEFLGKKPIYLKKGPGFLANKLKASIEDCNKALIEVRKKNKISIDTTDGKEIEKAALQYYIDNNLLVKAAELLNKLNRPKQQVYSTPNIKNGTYIILGCMHFPFHNKKMWEQVLKIITDTKDLSGIILAGDILDMHSISRHAKGKITLPDYDLSLEYEETNVELDKLDQAIGNKNIIKEFFYGNHEDWFNQWGSNVDNYKLGDSGAISPYNACFKDRGYNTQFNWKTASIQLAGYKVIHGEWCNVHSSHKHVMSLHESVIFFHTHRFNSYYESNLEGLNCGWGGDRTKKVFNYMSSYQKNLWRNGFCKVTVDNNGAYATPLPFINDTFIYNDKIYK